MKVKEKGFWAAIGATIAAVVSSACCWLPLLLVALGAGAAATSVAGFVETFRPAIVVAVLALLGAAAYFIYIRKEADDCCAPGERPDPPRLKKAQRYLFPFVAILALALSIFPNQILSVFAPGKPAASATLSAQADEQVFTLSVPGMT